VSAASVAANDGSPVVDSRIAGDRPLEWLPWIALFLIAFAWRGLLIEWFPEIFSWDPLTRLIERQHLFVRHWLPLPQVPLVIGHHLGLDLATMRLLYAAVGSTATVAAGLAAAKVLRSYVAGWMTGLLLSLLPGFIVTTIVPYQEGFMVLTAAMTVWGLHELRPVAPPDSQRRLAYVVAIAGLALGVLVRFELWILTAGVLCLGISNGWRRTKAPLVAVPAVLLCLVWIATAGMRDPAIGLSPDRMVVRPDAASVSFGALVTYCIMLFRMLGATLTVWGSALAVYGLWTLSREHRGLAVIFIVCFMGAAMLATLRAFNSTVLTTRMAFGPALVCLPVLAYGIVKLPNPRFHAVPVPIISLLALLSLSVFQARVGYMLVRDSAQPLEPERRAAAMLAEAPQTAVVRIVPRNMPNPWNESAAATVLGNSTSLDAHDPRFVYEESREGKNETEPDLLLLWCGTEYRLLAADSVPAVCQESPVDEIGQQLETGDEQ